jgi:hypothetical protein
MTYDSTFDTQNHITQVRNLMFYIVNKLFFRATDHDASKLESPEKEIFDEFTPKLRDLTYGSPEYKQALIDMGPALEHHYMCNSHHPEFFAPVTDDEIGEINAYLENLSKSDPAYGWLESYRNERESRLNGMSLLDVLEMLADWKAAGMRHKDGNLAESLEINHARFKISDQLQSILINTAQELGWL